jgi:cytochrome b561
VSRLLHWGFAIVILALFALGWWMVTLDYHSPFYNSAPYWHKAVGMVLLILLLPRLVWRLVNPKPSDDELSPFERRASALVHWGFYPLMLALLVSGYLIPTANGQPIDLFGLVSIPALVTGEGQEDLAGWIHEILAYVTMGLAALHAAAALKHHFADRSSILTRMWSGPPAE